MMNGGSSVIVIVNSDTASCSEKLQRSNRSGSMVGSRISGTMSMAMREVSRMTPAIERVVVPNL